jgi:hypothetical protein
MAIHPLDAQVDKGKEKAGCQYHIHHILLTLTIITLPFPALANLARPLASFSFGCALAL